jgi:microcystin-dependent protein
VKGNIMAVAADSFYGEIALFAFSKVPQDWTPCEGQTVAITSNPALYSVIGNKFGGDGKTTFILPDLRGMAVMGTGANPVLTPRNLGDKAGSNSVQLNAGHVGHSHDLMSSGQANPSVDKTRGPLPTSNVGALTVVPPGAAPVAEFSYAMNAQPNKMMHPAIISNTGGSVPHENRQPFVAMHYCICVKGIMPSQ